MYLPQDFIERSVSYLRGGDLEDWLACRLNLEGHREEAIPHLCREMENGVNGSRIRAADMLGDLGDSTAAPALVRMLSDQEVGSAAAHSLECIIKRAEGAELDDIWRDLSGNEKKLKGRHSMQEQVAALRISGLKDILSRKRNESRRMEGVLSERRTMPVLPHTRSMVRGRLTR